MNNKLLRICPKCGECDPDLSEYCDNCNTQTIETSIFAYGNFFDVYLQMDNTELKKVLNNLYNQYVFNSPLFDKELFDKQYASNITKFDYRKEKSTSSIKFTNSPPREDNTPRCPSCRSTNITKISITKKVAKVALFGIFGAGDNGKTYKCNHCGMKF